jgi:hypothetical protein
MGPAEEEAQRLHDRRMERLRQEDAQKEALKSELEEYRSGLRAIGIEGTATPRQTIIDLFSAKEKHHDYHHDRERVLRLALVKIRDARSSGCTSGEALSKIECWAREALEFTEND